ncbi:hypothetical protein EV192_105166 [Actinocrispum wychmicini]|uniref:DUF5655 domain-containing protein n=1 Tax=Actinocrispum wychmicini TaxID=1213861 RepID=A0A4R2JEK0_9PSEU|nr:hypothetical protein EV192_105166 [Actinocrispum wychmicini]
MCVPGCTLDEAFAGRDPVQRVIYDAILAHLTSLGPVHADVVRVGVFLLHERKLAEVRPMARSLRMYLVLPHPVSDPRLTLKFGDTWHQVKLTTVDDMDDQLRDWLSLAYDFAG